MDNNEPTIKLSSIFKQAGKVIKSGKLPKHDAFSISEVLGAATGLPKEYVMDQILKS